MSDELFSLEGKVALVTGSSTGLGKAMAVALGKAGAKVAMNYFNNEERANNTFAEFEAAGAPSPDQGLRVHGYVSTASIERNINEKQVRFVVQNDPPHAAAAASDTRLMVVYRSLETPDLFKDGAEVVVEGRLQGRGADAVFVADNVMAKCPSKFQAQAEAQPL